LIVIVAYIGGALTSDWWGNQYYNARVKAAEVIRPDSVITVSNTTGFVDSISKPTSVDLVIPFTEKNNAKIVEVKIKDGMTINAIFDTGCAYGLLLTPKTYYKLVGKGLIEEDKFTKQSNAILGDGSQVGIYHFTLPEFYIGTLTFTNQDVALISSGDDDIVGVELWKEYKSYTIDNENKQIVFTK